MNDSCWESFLCGLERLMKLVLLVVLLSMCCKERKHICDCENVQQANKEKLVTQFDTLWIQSDTLKILILNQSCVQQNTSPKK